MATKTDLRGYVSQLKSLFRLTQRFAHTLAEGRIQEKILVEKGSNLYHVSGQCDMSRWNMVDARKFGIKTSMISDTSRIVLKILQNEGFEAYLVGGCVRDLILKRTPKDFDVITTANLKQIKGIFHNAFIVGRRFPICQVNLKGCCIEVSSFTKAVTDENDEKEEAETSFPKRPKGCSEIDFVRWKDCARRDFTINSMFYDPFVHKIYDYANAMVDLKSSKLRTLTPAHMSFTEDCARILRGLRIAARLGFSFSKEIKTAIHELSSSVTSLARGRLMLELNYMLSYGAAEPSLCLLRRYRVLEIMLPFQDAYLINHSGDPGTPKSSMLMKLFSSLDKVVSCGQPCDCLLWIGLLAFHMALVTNPQSPLVAWTFSALLYHGNWNEALKTARQHAFDRVNFEPEILKSLNHLSDEELAEKVSKFASIVQESIKILTTTESLHNAMMAKYPSSPCSGMVFISRRFNEVNATLFDVLVHNVQSVTNKRESYEINHMLLGKGNIFEVRFVLGKIIMDTLSLRVIKDEDCEKEDKHSISSCIFERALGPIKKQKSADNERRSHQKPASSSKKRPQKNTVLQAGLAPEPVKKEKFIQKGQKKVMKEGKVSSKLGLSAKKKPNENTVLQEQPVLASEPIKNEKIIQKEQKKVMKEGKASQILGLSAKKKPNENTVLQEQPVLASEPIKNEKIIQKEQKKVMKEGKVSQILGLSAKKKPNENTVLQEHDVLDLIKKKIPIQKEQKNVDQNLASLFETKPARKTLENKADEKSVVKVGLLSKLFK